MAERMPSHKDPRRLDAYKRGIALYRRGLELRKEPVEHVEVPFGEHRLPALFSKAPVPGRAPCVVHFDGLDVTKEIIYPSIADEFRRRGISLLIVDHPGVGAALRLLGLTSGPDTEKPAGAAVDYLETRADVDREAHRHRSRCRSAATTRRAPPRSRSASSARGVGRDLRLRQVRRGPHRRPRRALGAGLRRARELGVRQGKTIEDTMKIVRQMTLEGRRRTRSPVRFSSSTARTTARCRCGTRSARSRRR